MKGSRYIIGIDLGTTNSSLSYIDTAEPESGIRTFFIPQLVDEGVVKELRSLPSFLYLPGEYELPPESTALPWDTQMTCIVGEFARLQGTRVPSNLVSSAKSWLCHTRVDREGPILPWGGETSAERVSPVRASSYYLKHMKDAWNYVMAKGDEKGILENQQIIITIPASFDEAARELTAKAAEMAGIEKFTMLEEPQAAFYAWISAHEEDWREAIGGDRLALIFDVGGGTTDFTLISIRESGEGPSFHRAAVGDHIMLGGDNMDLTLARKIEQTLAGPSGRFDFQQWLSATHQCRAAKEELLGGTDRESVPVTVLGKGRRVVGGAGRVDMTAGDIKDIILDGFFRKVEIGDEIEKGRVSGLQELGLPFVSDTAVMKHLSSFLRRHSVNSELQQITDSKSGTSVVRPDVLLFNGGVFRSPVIRKHTADLIREWFSGEEWSLTVLENREFDHAVSIGAAYYGRVLRGTGKRISGGLGKAYYMAVETEGGPGADGLKNPLTLVCIVPKGTEEGGEIHLSTPEFQVMTNSPVSFALHASSYRVGDKTGDIITAERDEFVELPPVKTILHYGKKAGSVRIPVSLGIRLNEFGTMDVWCESKTTPHTWKLAFQLRTGTETGADESVQVGEPDKYVLDESALQDAASLIERAFYSSPRKRADVTPENLIKKIEASLDLGRKDWPLFGIRKMWDVLSGVRERRKAAPMHEARWLNLSGFLLRPGFGYQLDEWRMKEIWKVFLENLTFPNNGQCRSEWWILWRRVAGGLDSARQDIIFRKISPWLLPSKKKVKRLSAAETSEMWMLAASLEHLDPRIKTQLGDVLVHNPGKWKGKSREQYYWAISRLGARVPFHGPIDKVVSKDDASRWIETLLTGDWPLPRNAAHAVVQLSRKTDDRLRDIDEALRGRIIGKLSEHGISDRLIKQVEEVVSLEMEDEKEIFGESLPAGLYIEDTCP